MSIRFMTPAKAVRYTAIPLDAGQVRGWKAIPIRGSNPADPLVPLGLLSGEAGILTSAIYFGEHTNSPYTDDKHTLEGSLLTLFARQSVARRLLAAERLLPNGHHLLVFDAYRPYLVQKSLYDFYKQKLQEKHPALDGETLDGETQKYVSVPSEEPAHPSPHNTGGAVDLAIVKLDQAHEKELQQIRSCLAGDNLSVAKRVGMELRLSAIMRHHAKMLDFGTPFDHGGEKSALAYYESRLDAGEILSDEDMRACQNRRLLFNVMAQAGLQPYFAEWWHFNAPESQMGAAAAGLNHATFGAADFDVSNRTHENTRLAVRQEVLRLQREREGDLDVPRLALETEILAVIHETDDPRTVEGWPAEIIKPAE